MSDVPHTETNPEALLTVSGNALSTLPEWELEARAPVYLASEVHISAYGVRGFLLVDSHPENRQSGYHSTRWYGSGEVFSGSEDADPEDVEQRELSPMEVAREYGTRHGFKAIRFIVLPHAVTDFFAQDKWLGEPAIEKCIEDVGTPPGYWEQPVRPGKGMIETDDRLPRDQSRELQQRKLAALARILPLLDPDTTHDDLWNESRGEYDNHYIGNGQQRAYLSFHPWQIYQEVTTELSDSVKDALTNFDEALAHFDTTGSGLLATAKEWVSEGNTLKTLVAHPLAHDLPQLEAGNDLSD
jgi:hypothetical protein